MGEPAAFIVDAVGDVGRPRAGLPPTGDFKHLPGESGLWAGLANLAGWMRRGRAHLRDQMKKYGTIYRTQAGPIPIVCVAEPDLIAEIGRNEERVWSTALAWRVFFEGVSPGTITVDSPVVLDFDYHKDARKLLQPAFSAPALQSYVDMAAPIFEAAVDDWVARGQVAFKPAVRRTFAKVAGRIFLGVADDAEAELLDRTLAAYWRAPMAMIRNPWISPTWRRAMRAYERLFAMLRARVAERRERGGEDLFSRLCRTAADVSWIDDDTIVKLFIGVMAGAFDTTSLAVTSMAYLLCTHPEWQERLREEARAVPGRARYEQLKQLERHEWVWKESLRLYPVAGDFPRRALREVTLGQHRLPAGAMVLAMISTVMNDPRFWTDPDRFDPDRFSPERAEDKKHKGTYLPFGAGAHACIGAQLSGLESRAFWHTMLSRCRMSLAKPYQAAHQLTPLGAVSGDVDLTLTRV